MIFFNGPQMSFFFTILFSSLSGRIMLRCIYGCEKWIPDKIPHRNDNSIFFSTHFFSTKFFILKMKKYFSGNFWKKNSNFFENHWRKIRFFLWKKLIFRKFWKFPQKIFCNFQSENFCRKKMSWQKNWNIMSMWNFVRNPFLASINATEHCRSLCGPSQYFFPDLSK